MGENSMKIVHSLICEELQTSFGLFILSLKSILFNKQTDKRTTEL